MLGRTAVKTETDDSTTSIRMAAQRLEQLRLYKKSSLRPRAKKKSQAAITLLLYEQSPS